jgi:hypothetical protein
MDSFDLKKYLVENKVTANSKMVKEEFTDPLDLLYSLPDYSEEYLEKHDLEDYIDSSDSEGNATYVLDELGIPTEDVYKVIPTGDDNGAEEYLYYDLGDGYVLGTDDYTYTGPSIHKKIDFDNLIEQHPELGATNG